MFAPLKPQAFRGVRALLVVGLLTLLSANSGCETAAGTGAASGGLLGAGIGALAGHCPGAALAGAAIGAGAGTLAGAGVDIARDRRAQKAAQAASAQAIARAPTLEDIVSMTQNAVPTQQIVEQIRTSGVIYRLTADQLVYLNRNGVDSRVIIAMQDTALNPAPVRTVYTAAPVVVEQPVLVTPPPVVGVGFGWGYR